MIFPSLFKNLFLLFFMPQLTGSELYILFKIIIFCAFKKDNLKNQKIIAGLISDLEILPVKLAQWMGYFLKVQFESRKEYKLLLNSLPYLQSDCKIRKTSLLELKLTEFNHIIKEYICIWTV